MKPEHPADLRQKPSQVVKRSIVIGGHKTSVRLEESFWNALKEIAASKEVTLSDLVTRLNDDRTARQRVNLSSAIRLFVFDHHRRMAELKREKD